MKKKKLNTVKLFFKKEKISNLVMSDVKGKGVPTEYENLSQQLTYYGPSGNNCAEICWEQGTRGLCTDELNTCGC